MLKSILFFLLLASASATPIMPMAEMLHTAEHMAEKLEWNNETVVERLLAGNWTEALRLEEGEFKNETVLAEKLEMLNETIAEKLETVLAQKLETDENVFADKLEAEFRNETMLAEKLEMLNETFAAEKLETEIVKLEAELVTEIAKLMNESELVKREYKGDYEATTEFVPVRIEIETPKYEATTEFVPPVELELETPKYEATTEFVPPVELELETPKYEAPTYEATTEFVPPVEIELETTTEYAEQRYRREEAVEVDAVIAKLCESSATFKYFQPHPVDVTKYVQCDPWGTATVKSCENGQIWDEWTLRCNWPAQVKNTTIDLVTLEKSVAVISKVDCKKTECQNGGVCELVNDWYRCSCVGNFTGDLCEIAIDSEDIYSEIMSGRFSLVEYREELSGEMLNNTEYMEREQWEKEQMDKETYDAFVKYEGMYKKGEVRYDFLLKSLIIDILQNIYPDVYYLTSYNASAETVIDVVRTIPNLLSYTKYSAERYEQVFFQYVKVLGELKPVLNSSWPTIAQEATEYSQLASLFLNRTLVEMNKEIGESSGKLSEADMKEKMKEQYNQTLDNSNQLYDILVDFQTRAIEKIKAEPEMANMTLVACKSIEAKETIRLLDEIVASSQIVWGALVNFGFWFITNEFAPRV